jgi:hypothetical protein
MSESTGVPLGRICPSCGQQNSVRLVWGLPLGDTMDLAERGLVELGGCMLGPGAPDFACRSCGLQWGHESDPTADEQALAELLGVRYADVVRALGTGWRREFEDRGGVQWFVSGEPAQVAVGVHGPTFVLARPLTRWDEGGLDLQPADRREFGRDDLLHFPEVVAEAADEIASRRRRSFRWCRMCRRVHPPEWFVGTERVCQECESALATLEVGL